MQPWLVSFMHQVAPFLEGTAVGGLAETAAGAAVVTALGEQPVQADTTSEPPLTPFIR